MALARGAARQALELDEGLGDAHISMAITHLLGDWDWTAAERSFLRGLELTPNSTLGHNMYAVELAYLGRLDEAIAQLERTRSLDPLNVNAPTETDLGRLYELNGEPEKAAREWQRNLELEPDSVPTLRHQGNSYCQRGEYARGIEMLEHARKGAPKNAVVAADLGHCYGVAGRREQALEIVELLEAAAQQTYVSPLAIALVRLGLGELELALDWLERAYEVRAVRTLSLALEVRFEPLHSHPRFQDLLRRIGFPES
jgi:tetratricopeptide (TPR) repeat protein